MNTKALRQKILDLAIRGKLVPQDPNDEPASVLLERIRAEKQQMVKDGSLKATILQDGVGQINGAIEIVESLVAGEEFDPAPVIPFVLITQDNVDDYLQ